MDNKIKSFNSNTTIVLDFYTKVLGQGDINLADDIIKNDYIQHSPTVKTGKDGFIEFMSFLKQLPQPKNLVKPFMRLISDENFVIVHLSIKFMEQQKAVLDLYRLKDGFLAEHWDASEDITGFSVNHNPVVEGTITIENISSTKENKSIIHKYTEHILVNRSSDQWTNYVSTNVIQHNPKIKNGRRALIEYYKKIDVKKVHRILGEGNFVVTQSEVFFETVPFVVYDIYRLKDKMIVEHWSVSQKIPENMAHHNGMF
ncbi:nuclear transport factor 2 family protein [Aquimarina algiphila]|uniref:nuclear transport factor 2 family protein n=1 Tax=Aquimarina algiphila TaxID=2047982 RepID=UPI00249159C8|nr:hypothetical protein [Aquimarina algiphila]